MKHTRISRLRARSGSPAARFWVFKVLLVSIFLMGGGSRADILSLMVLRPLAALFAIYAVLQITSEEVRSVRAPLMFLGSIALLIALQLVPLPPDLWRSLPGRQVYAAASAAAGVPLPWQPVAIVPGRALNSLFSLIVPLAVLLAWALQDDEKRSSILLMLWIAALVSAFLGILQLLGPSSGPLYLYRITSNGLPVGLFANRNHQAFMVSVGILLSGYLAVRGLRRARPSLPMLTGAGSAIMIFVPFLLVAGSRAGLVLGAAMTVVAALLVAQAWKSRNSTRRQGAGRRSRVLMISAAAAALLGAVIGASIWFSRSLALERLLGKSVELDLRVQVMPTVLEIARNQFPVGSGFGSFEFIYRQFEPARLLMPSYLNHAHNDWVEFVLEGGLPGVLMIAAFLIWLAQAAFTRWKARARRWDPETVVVTLVVVAIGLFSVVDYPLRVPSLMAVGAIACAMLAQRQRQH